jgi:trehalose-phosphatase
MATPRNDAALRPFFAQVRRAKHRALLLDYDGTLAPFNVRPDQAFPYPGVCPLLDEIISGTNTRVILISGRWTRDLVPLLNLKRRPEIWGSHGWERLGPEDDYVVGKPDESALRALAEADNWSEELIALGARREQKPACLALHWRGLAPECIAPIREKVTEKWSRLGRDAGLGLHDFDGGMELRVPGRDKGFVVDTVLREMDTDTVAAYLGDDLTDEDAFKAINGRGLPVLVRGEFRPTAAQCWLKPADELLAFLRRWQEACGGRK